MSARRLAAVALLPLTLLLLFATVGEGAAKKDGKRKSAKQTTIFPRVGVYEAEPSKPTGDFLLGSFAVVRDVDGTRIVGVETKDGIYYPSVYGCRSAPLPLRADVIQVKPSGRFRIRESRSTSNGKLTVRWSGRWVRPSTVKGKVRIKVKRCKQKFRWVARRLPPEAL